VDYFYLEKNMFNIGQSKIAIDPKVDESISRVALSSAPLPKNTPKTPEKPVIKQPVSIIALGIGLFFDFLESIVVAASIFVVVYLFFVQPHEVKGSSMEPSFHNNEYILTDKISYRFKNPERGEVVIFKAPNNPEVDYIKRIIALPGEKVKVEKGLVYVNDQKLDEVYLKDSTYLFPSSKMQEGVNVFVGNDELFVMGDNRPHSSDSREFGPIQKKSIVGRAFLRYWPINEIGLVPEIKY
jgi:signal peptidase I